MVDLQKELLNNRFFRQMKKIGREARNKNENYQQTFSKAESLAYKYWALACRYHSDYILIDEQITANDVKDVFEVYKKAGIFELVIADDIFCKMDLGNIECKIKDECRVFRQETELYQGKIQTYYGRRILLLAGGQE